MEIIRVPLLNANEDEVDIVEVCVREGNEVRSGDLLFVVETTKVTFDVEAPCSGYVRKLSVEKGQRVRVDSLLCVLASNPNEAVNVEEVPASNLAQQFRASRKAQELAQRNKLDLSSLGLTGIIKESDVERFLMERAVVKRKAGALKREPLQSSPESGQPVLMYGAGGHARVLIDLIRQSNEFFVVAAVDDDTPNDEVLGVPVLCESMLTELRTQGIDHAVLGIGSTRNHQRRAKLYDRLVAAGFKVPNLIHPRAMVEPSVSLGIGNQIFAGAVVSSAAKLGDNTIINSGAVISHDCVIGSHTHVSPGAILAGGVEIGENTLVGMGVTIFLGVRIGSNVIVANGCNILTDVPDGSIVRTASPLPHSSSA
jgi:sugar O-acyltransferase (sialic acid O-acetyltransferase NeuD family)